MLAARSIAPLREGPKRALLKLKIQGMVYPIGSTIPADVWGRLPCRMQDKFLHSGIVEVAVDGAPRQSPTPSFPCPICAKTFKSVQAKGGHMRGHAKRGET